MSKHYCGGELEVVSFYKSVEECCCGIEAENICKDDKKDCCKDEKSFSKLQSDQAIKESKIILQQHFLFVEKCNQCKFYNSNTEPIVVLKIINNNYCNPPPNIYQHKLFLQFCQWKLYS